MQKHFVTFLIPVAPAFEEKTFPIDAWDALAAVELAKSIDWLEGAKPFAFRFSTRELRDGEFESRETVKSQRFYLGGSVLTAEEIQQRNEPKDEILIANMKTNGWKSVVFTSGAAQIAQPLLTGDRVLDFTV